MTTYLSEQMARDAVAGNIKCRRCGIGILDAATKRGWTFKWQMCQTCYCLCLTHPDHEGRDSFLTDFEPLSRKEVLELSKIVSSVTRGVRMATVRDYQRAHTAAGFQKLIDQTQKAAALCE